MWATLLVAVGIAELPSGLAEAREVMDRNADAETVDMERKISMLAVLGTLGPMMGRGILRPGRRLGAMMGAMMGPLGSLWART